jgi:P2-related tail formation protein
MMRVPWVAVAALLAMRLGSLTAAAETLTGLEPLHSLLGDWQAEGGGKPGEASGGFTFAASLQGRVIVRTNYAEYPATADKPASRHDDLMVLFATESGALRADYYDSEGHVIRYAGSATATGEVVLVSEVVGGAPRFRLTYKLRADGSLDGRFEIAPPGKPEAFGPYLAWTARRRDAHT